MAKKAKKVHSDQREVEQVYDTQINLSWNCLTPVGEKKLFSTSESCCYSTGINYTAGVVHKSTYCTVIHASFLSQWG